MKSKQRRLIKRVKRKNCHNPYTPIFMKVNEWYAAASKEVDRWTSQVADTIAYALNWKHHLAIENFHIQLKKHAKKRRK